MKSLLTVNVFVPLMLLVRRESLLDHGGAHVLFLASPLRHVSTLLIVAVLVGVSAGCRPSMAMPRSVTPRPGARPVASSAPAMEVPGKTQPAPGRLGLVAPAVLHPVARVLAASGDRVQAGQPLVQLDDDEPRAVVRARKAALEELRVSMARLRAMPREHERAEARGTLEAARVATQLARTHLERYEALYQSGAVAARSYHEAQAAVSRLEAEQRAAAARLERLLQHPVDLEVAELEARLVTAEAQLAEAEARLRHHRIVAPIDGVVSRLEVGPGTVTLPGTVAWGEILDLREIDVRCELTPDEADDLTVGQAAVVSLDGHPEARWCGRVVVVSVAAEPRTGRIPAVLRLTNPGERLHCYIDVKVRFDAATTRTPRTEGLPENPSTRR